MTRAASQHSTRASADPGLPKGNNVTKAAVQADAYPTPASSRMLPIDPSELPDRYCMFLEGNCLEPEIPANTVAVFDKTLPVGGGDIVIIFFLPEVVAPGGYQGHVKRLVMGLPPGLKFPWRRHPDTEWEPVILAEQFNPPRRFAFPPAAIAAIHRYVGPLPAGITAVPVSAGER